MGMKINIVILLGKVCVSRIVILKFQLSAAVQAFNSSTRRQKQASFCEFEAGATKGDYFTT